MKLKSKRNLLIISLVILVIDVVFVLLNHKIAENTFEEETARSGEQLKLDYELILDQTYRNLTTLVNFIGNDKEILNIFHQAYQVNKEPNNETKLNILRNKLNAQLQSNWSNLQIQFLVRQLHFHFGPGSTSFLRVHRPGKFGDNMDDVRHTIVAANRTLEPVQGFETGRVYSGLRSVIPLFYHNSENEKIHIGALEAGASFDNVLNALADKMQLNAAVLLSKAHAEKNMWPDAIIRVFGNTPLSTCECYLESSTSESVKYVIEKTTSQGVYFRKQGTLIVELDQHYFSLTHFPLYDFNATQNNTDPIGAVLIWKDATHEVETLNNSKWVNNLYGATAFILVEILLLIGVKLTTNHLKTQVRTQTAAISLSEKRLNEAQAIGNSGSWELDFSTNTLFWSDHIYEIFELDQKQFSPSYENFLNSIHPDDRSNVDKVYNDSLRSKKPYQVIHRVLTASGKLKYIEEKCHTTFTDEGQPIKSLGVIIDITERYLLQEKDKLANQVFKYANEGLIITDKKGIVVDVNPAFSDITGYSKDEVLGKTPSLLSSGKHDKNFYKQMWDELNTHKHWKGDIYNKKKSGDIYPERLNISAIPGHNNEVSHYVGLFTDISIQKNYEDKLFHSAMHDQLTGLPNRTLMIERLGQGMMLADRNNSQIAILFIDLDGFKDVNDKYGHDAGDFVLTSVAATLQKHCRKTDTCVRLGGDEFLLIYTQVTNHQDITSNAKAILEDPNNQLEFEGQQLEVSMSIGIRFYQSSESSDIDDLLKDADHAMYQAKSRGKQQYVIFEG